MWQEIAVLIIGLIVIFCIGKKYISSLHIPPERTILVKDVRDVH